MNLFLGIDLAWKDDATVAPNESGVLALAGDGVVLDAGWTRGITETVDWIERIAAGCEHVLCFVDAPLVVTNATGQRLCEK